MRLNVLLMIDAEGSMGRGIIRLIQEPAHSLFRRRGTELRSLLLYGNFFLPHTLFIKVLKDVFTDQSLFLTDSQFLPHAESFDLIDRIAEYIS